MATSNSPAKQFIIKASGGLVRTESQAMIVIMLLFFLSIIISIFMVIQTFLPQEAPQNVYNIPVTDTTIEEIE